MQATCLARRQSIFLLVKGYAQADHLAVTRHNCSMCHTPQADDVRTVKSTFTRVKGKNTQ